MNFDKVQFVYIDVDYMEYLNKTFPVFRTIEVRKID